MLFPVKKDPPPKIQIIIFNNSVCTQIKVSPSVSHTLRLDGKNPRLPRLSRKKPPEKLVHTNPDPKANMSPSWGDYEYEIIR